MAVDGVAPRAKMNQQRSRRFRTAKEAKELVEQAIKKGEKLPDEKAFDSNCITPGTPFMAKLSLQLQYFVNKKISEDSNWRDVQVILSGHEIPGEGEHKIMEYIRLSKAQKNYNPNTRHCLYGLDADLIMLGLLSHDPHFCLLREEVKFGPQSKKKSGSLETQNFFLLHLCLFREYLNLEFQPLWDSNAVTLGNEMTAPQPAREPLPFPYSLERIIDDFILLAVFIGNDFLPHLPDLHIHENALEVLYEKYRETLPKAGGYLNEGGVINVQRLQMVLDALATFELHAFEKEHSDMNWFKSKQRPKEFDTLAERGGQGAFTITKDQRQMLGAVESFIQRTRDKTHRSADQAEVEGQSKLSFVNSFPARDRSFLTKLAGELKLSLTWDEYDEQDQNLAVLRVPRANHADDSDDSSDDEGRIAVDRVLNKYKRANILEDEGTAEERYEVALKARMDNWKRDYYREKLEIKHEDNQSISTLVFRYVEGLQWVMHYYYSGVASWGWFYDYHYAPRISDFKNIDKMEFHFNLGTPFRPFEQLMGVLPEASKEHIPEAYRDLMYDANSPILDFYPKSFATDLNGKKQDWEAIVKIPFIDENRLLRAMALREHRLTKEERQRNSIGSSLTFTYSPDQDIVYPSSLPGFFPDLHHCHCTTKPFNLPTLDGLHLVKGLLDGVGLGIHAMAGFPSLDTVPHTAQLLHHSVNVFQQDSRNQSIVLFVKNIWDNNHVLKTAEQMIGQRLYYNWPFLQEGMVVALSDSHFRYEYHTFGNQLKVSGSQHSASELSSWARKAEGHESRYSKRFGAIIGDVDILVHLRPLKGLKSLDDGALVKEWESETNEVDVPIQLVVKEGLKVLTYTKMDGNGWEYSAKAVELLRDYKSAFPQLFNKLDNRGDAMMKSVDVFPGDAPDNAVKAAKAWLAEHGVRDLDPVPLSTQALEKETVAQIELVANSLTANRSAAAIKKAKVQGIPRRAVLKPAQVGSRLQGQIFHLGDRVIMVQDSGGVSLCAKGVVIGLVDKMIDVVWDNAFIGGTTLGGRCSEYRGSTCSIDSCLNLTNRQFIISTAPTQASQPVPVHLMKAYTNQRGGSSSQNGGPAKSSGYLPRGRGGNNGSNLTRTSSEPSVLPQDEAPAVNLFHSARARGFRGRGPVVTRGRGGPPSQPAQQPISILQNNGTRAHSSAPPSATHTPSPRGRGNHSPRVRGNGENRGRAAPAGRGSHQRVQGSGPTVPS
ncbi:hypothetical protein FRC15_011110 [Serendipita sp. 397]|nr:hypothetical protein FRC15_011110 [Serendipita sp. 397]